MGMHLDLDDVVAGHTKATTELADLRLVERKLRHMLFMAHGNEEHYLYGDDGERSCNTCMIDFNKDSPDEIEQKIFNYNTRKIARLQADGKWPLKWSY